MFEIQIKKRHVAGLLADVETHFIKSKMQRKGLYCRNYVAQEYARAAICRKRASRVDIQ